jgi:hypothetical protein
VPPLRPSSEPINLILIALLGLIAPAAALITSPPRALLIALAAGLAYAAACQLAFTEGTILPLLYPIPALTIGTLGILAAALGLRRAVRTLRSPHEVLF